MKLVNKLRKLEPLFKNVAFYVNPKHAFFFLMDAQLWLLMCGIEEVDSLHILNENYGPFQALTELWL